MFNYKKLFCLILCFCLAGVIALYLFTVLVIPFLFNLDIVQDKITELISDKTMSDVRLSGAKLDVKYNLNFNFHLNKILVLNNSDIFDVDNLNLEFNPFKKSTNKISINKIHIVKVNLNSKKSDDNHKINFNLSYIPDIKINEMKFELGSTDKVTSEFLIHDFIISNNNSFKLLDFDLKFSSKYLLSPVKINKASKFYIVRDGIYAKNAKIIFQDSICNIDGKIFDINGNNDFTVNGDNLPVYDIERAFLLFIKHVKKKKNFIENFRDFSGKISVNLNIKAKKIRGNVKLTNLEATTVPLSVPIKFKNADFTFSGDKISLKEYGTLGNKSVYTDFYLDNLMSDDMTVTGSVKSAIDNDFAKIYFTDVFILDKVGLNVKYKVKNGVIDVIYNASLDKMSDISYKGARLGLVKLNRQVSAKTRKTGDMIELTEYSYGADFKQGHEEIIKGSGKFKKINGKYKLTVIEGTTKTNAPAALLGFLEDRLRGGIFNGNLSYDFLNNSLKGNLSINNTNFKGYKVKSASISAQDDKININADGTYQNEPFRASIILLNSLTSDVKIKYLDLYLKRYVFSIKPDKKTKRRFHIPKKPQNLTVNADKFILMLDEFKKDNIFLENIKLEGNVVNNVIYFNIKDTEFAEGKLFADGVYDFNKQDISVDFRAQNISANEAGYQVFNLKDHFEGLTNAKLHADIKNNFKTLNGCGSFEINDGELVKIGSVEFIVRRSKKKRPFVFSLSDIVKIDDKLVKDKSSNIKGDFILENKQVQNAKIYMQNDLVSLYLEGSYNIENEYADLKMWGKYDKKTEGMIKVFKIPLGLITKFLFDAKEMSETYVEKILKIPFVKGDKDDLKTFMIFLKGYANNPKSFKVEFQRLK